jgi:enterochelin esterase-like enzyme
MRKSSIVSLALLFLLMPAVQQPIAATIIHASHFSKYMGNKTWWFNIYLPPSYNTNTQLRYPVIYFLHGGGGGGDENQLILYVNDYVDSYIRQGKVPECIVVFPSADRSPDLFWMDSGIIYNTVKNPDSYVTKELIPHIDSLYRTISDRKARAVSGMSMGGFGTFHFCFKYPNLFCAGGPFSAGGPYVNGVLKLSGYSPADDPHKLAVTNAAILSKQMRMYISVGATDGLMGYSQDLANICKAQSIPYVFTVVPGVGHDLGGQMQKDGVEAVQYITNGFAPVSVAKPNKSVLNSRFQANISLQGTTLRINTALTQTMTVELITLSGKITGSYRTNGQNMSLDLSKYARGMYCVRMHGASGTMEKRVFLDK